jgi:hypothetical protein
MCVKSFYYSGVTFRDFFGQQQSSPIRVKPNETMAKSAQGIADKQPVMQPIHLIFRLIS